MATLSCLRPTANDIKMMVLAETHLSTLKCEPGMRPYVYGKADGSVDPKMAGSCLMDLQKTWDKIVLAARILATVEDPKTIYCVGHRDYAQRAIIKFAKEIGATAAPGRFTPGQFTNQITDKFVEPRILVVADPRTDSQAVKESSYVNIPTIAFCGSDSPLEYVDVCIPGNNRGKESLGLLYWMLAREVRRIRDGIPRDHPWEVKVDLFIYRDPEDIDSKIAEAEQNNFGNEEEDFGVDYDATYDVAYDDQAFVAAGDDAAAVVAGGPGGDQQQFNQQWDQNQPQVQDEWGAGPPSQMQGGPQPMHGAVQGDWNDAGQFQDYQPPAPQQQQAPPPPPQQQYYQQPPQQQYSAPPQQYNPNQSYGGHGVGGPPGGPGVGGPGVGGPPGGPPRQLDDWEED